MPLKLLHPPSHASDVYAPGHLLRQIATKIGCKPPLPLVNAAQRMTQMLGRLWVTSWSVLTLSHHY